MRHQYCAVHVVRRHIGCTLGGPHDEHVYDVNEFVRLKYYQRVPKNDLPNKFVGKEKQSARPVKCPGMNFL